MMCLINLSSNCEIVQEIWKKKFDVQRMVKKLFMVGTKKLEALSYPVESSSTVL